MKKAVRVASWILLGIYIGFVAWRMFFFAYGSYFRSQSAALQYNLIPFKTILSLIMSYKAYAFEVWVYNLFGNVAVFVPLGFLLPVALSGERKLKAALVISLLLITAAEAAQLITRFGVFDIDDIILNMLGVGLGYFLFVILTKFIKYIK